MNKYCFFIACLLVWFNTNSQNNSFDVMLDSIQRLRRFSKNEKSNLDIKFKYAKLASDLSYKTKIDSTILISNTNLAYLYMLKNNLEHSKKMLDKNLKLAYKLNDSSSILNTCSILGYYHHLLGTQNDSAYYYYDIALKLSRKFKSVSIEIDILNNIAELQSDEHNYVNSDANLIEAINKINSLPINDENLDKRYYLYNQIATNAKHLKLYDKAIEYYQKTLLFNDKISDEHELGIYVNKFKNYLDIKINLAEVYKEKKDYKKALFIYKELLEDKSLLKKDPLSYMTILNNKAYNLFLSKNSNTKHINSLFNKAYKICDSLNALYEIAAGGNDMAEFYHAINKKDSALILSKRSYKIGKSIKEYYEVSRALLTLSKIEEGEMGKQYLYEHIKLNDSLLDIERASRNKFARIQYETDNYIDETKRLGTQNILIVIIGLIIILIFILIFIIRIQITKNKMLRFESEQQKANDEIYSLMLRQQAKVEEGRLLERHRISEELHDGILNKLSGSRLGLEFLSMDESNSNKKNYSFYINEIQSIEREIRDLSHELKNTLLDADKNFITILEEYIHNQSKLNAFAYSINQNNVIFWEDINDYIKINLYRIIQEAIQNTIKHAKANSITINLSINSNNLCVEIIDDGMGFDSTQKNEGIGLVNIESRISKLKGAYKIKSEIKKGTALMIIIPLS
ncbi:ATP-binding protein [Flavivirga abyssicola]|uniref:ATP-binding protein n=1 Tax=Flavivirga abyssicola TaxID=3063533 RepID=UPI0026E04211|nr:tetratricopeptide repeat-containing sensor histidine kinase [Flavivirga sp. MEBiC07777]WVK13381.1 ATP-binding protein [Flavivirga sp. MEBiC07777]